MLNKKILTPIFSVAAAGTILFGVSTIVHAQTGNPNPFSGLAATIASKFNLNQTDVQAAIAAYMKQQKGNWQQNLQQREKQRLDQLVSQGKITNDQETTILNELATLQTQYSPSSLKAMTQAERKQAMQQEKNAITSWANSQGINPMYVMPFGMHRGGGWNKLKPTPTP